jgi:hypothetical protein
MALDALTAIVEADDAQCLGQSHIEQARAAIAALRAMDAEARKRGEMYPQTRDEQEADTKAVRNVIESLEFYTSGRQVGANGWPGIKDWPALPVASTVAALKAERDAALARVAELEKDAARYRWLRSVPNAFKAQRIVNDTPHGMDATIDAAMNGGNQ